MGLLKLLKDIFIDDPPTVGELNRAATATPTQRVRPNLPTQTAGQRPLTRDRSSNISDIEVTNEYVLVKSLIETHRPLIFVNGKAGTGKSTLIRYLRYSLRQKNIVVVAPTGVAALNVMGVTVHSLFHFPPRIIDLHQIREVEDRRLYKKIDIIIVDEISMVRVDLIDAMDKFMRLNGQRKNLPFGGVQMVFIGDLFQLPPVVNSAEEEVLRRNGYQSPYFFSAKSLEPYKIIPVELNKIYRQTDERYTSALNDIRVAANVSVHLEKINERKRTTIPEQEQTIILTANNRTADTINSDRLHQLPGEVKRYTGTVTGSFNINEVKLPSPMELELNVGAQVMFTKNDTGHRWVNGTLGMIVSLDADSIHVAVENDSGSVRYEVNRVTWEKYSYRYNQREDRIESFIEGTFTQFPVMLAWAITIHKSQGQTLSKMHLDLRGGAFATGQVYVALSRVRQLQDLTLQRAIRVNDVRCDHRIVNFFQRFASIQDKMRAAAENLHLDDIAMADTICPYCWNELRERNGSRGRFWGCSGYPNCTYTRNIEA